MFQIVDVPLEAPRKLFPPAKRRVLPFSKLPFDHVIMRHAVLTWLLSVLCMPLTEGTIWP